MWALAAQRQKLGLDGATDTLLGEPLRKIVLDAMAGSRSKNAYDHMIVNMIYLMICLYKSYRKI